MFPLPSESRTGASVIGLDDGFVIAWSKAKRPAQDLVNAITKTNRAVLETTHRFLSPDRGASLSRDCTVRLGTMIVVLESEDPGSIMSETLKPLRERREAYTLIVPDDGQSPAVIRSTSSLGIFRGLTTFEQLFYAPPKNAPGDTNFTVKAFAPCAPYIISDNPAFPWRGFMLDTSRNFFSKQAILKTLDTMSFVKLNVFHWHITDSHSWPLSLPGHRELAEGGAYSSDELYDEHDIAEIVQYAGERGIDIVMEVDMPGHTASIHASHPDLVVGMGQQPWTTYANEPPAGQLRFMLPEAAKKIRDVLSKLEKVLPSRYFATGGDEINEVIYENDEISQSALKKQGRTLRQALDHFMGGVWSSMDPKIPVVWQEMVQEHAIPSLSKEAVVLIWKNSQDASTITESGRSIVHSPSDYFYLDLGEGAWVVPETGAKPNDWDEQSFKPWHKVYSFNPYQGICENDRHLVLGGQTALWTERTDEMNLESKVWPRAAAAAEVFWTGNQRDEFPLDARQALRRFSDLRFRLVSRGTRASPLQPQWIALRPGSC